MLERELEHSLVGHSERIESLALTPDGRYCVSGSQDCTARVWEVATGSLKKIFNKHTYGPLVLVTTDGRRAISASSDSIHVWLIDAYTRVRDLSEGSCSSIHRDVRYGHGLLRRAVAVTSAANELSLAGWWTSMAR